MPVWKSFRHLAAKLQPVPDRSRSGEVFCLTPVFTDG